MTTCQGNILYKDFAFAAWFRTAFRTTVSTTWSSPLAGFTTCCNSVTDFCMAEIVASMPTLEPRSTWFFTTTLRRNHLEVLWLRDVHDAVLVSRTTKTEHWSQLLTVFENADDFSPHLNFLCTSSVANDVHAMFGTANIRKRVYEVMPEKNIDSVRRLQKSHLPFVVGTHQ